MKWICDICGYVYDGEDFTKEEDFVCPLCEGSKEHFSYRNMEAELENATNEITIKNTL